MSAFLGHIHYWLFNKIRRVEEREQLIYAKASDICGMTAEEVLVQARQLYGEPLLNSDLSELIDITNIHGWLQRRINIAESREAVFIKELLEMCGDTGKDVVAASFEEHGGVCGRHARQLGKYNISTASGIYKALNDYYLNGMPCDQVDMVVVDTPEKVIWEGEQCLQEPNWKKVRMNAKVMKYFYQKWLAGFVAAINPEFYYSQTADTLAGNRVNRHEIIRKS